VWRGHILAQYKNMFDIVDIYGDRGGGVGIFRYLIDMFEIDFVIVTIKDDESRFHSVSHPHSINQVDQVDQLIQT
jgi:hypothetical protein